MTLGQGGNTILVGQRFNIIQYGRNLFDPHTGESLGLEEMPVGLIKVVSVQAKTSRAKIIKLEIDLGKNFELGKFIVRAVKADKSYEKDHQKSSRMSGGNTPIKSRKKIINDDDW